MPKYPEMRRPSRTASQPSPDADTAAGAPTLRERKRSATKARVADLAIELFAARGFAAVSVDEICAAAEIAPRSFFRYFPTKADVLREPVLEMSSFIEASLETASAELDDAAALSLALRGLAEYMLEHWGRLDDFFRVAVDTGALRASPLVHLTDRERAITEHLQQRRGDAGPADWRTRLLVARTLGAFRIWLEDVRTLDVPDPIRRLDEILAAD